MKIIHIVRDNFNPNSLNGVYKVVDSISNSLAKKGHEVVVCSVAPQIHTSIFKPSSYSHIQVKEHSLRVFLTNSFKRFLLSQSKDTVFHFHSVFIPWFLFAVKLLRKNGFERIVLTPHGQYVNEAMRRSLKKRIFFRFIDANVLKSVNKVQVIGHTEINKYITECTNQYFLIPNGSTSVRINEVTPRELIFGYLGRIECSQKGLDLLVNGFSKYKTEGGTGILRIAGAGPDEDKIRCLVKECGMSGSVFFDGIVYDEQKWRFLNKCAFFLHLSRWDVIPTASLEAASCGVPLIVSPETNLDTYIVKYNSGLVVNIAEDYKKNISDALHTAERIYNDRAVYKSICFNTRRMIEESLNWDIIAVQDIELLYKS